MRDGLGNFSAQETHLASAGVRQRRPAARCHHSAPYAQRFHDRTAGRQLLKRGRGFQELHQLVNRRSALTQVNAPARHAQHFRGYLQELLGEPLRIDELIDRLAHAPQRAIELILPLIETAAGVVRSFDIALAGPRVVGLVFGAFDYTLDMGTSWSKEGIESNFARQKIPIDARAAGISAIDTVYPDPNDEEGFLNDVKVGKKLGYTGKTIIHPKQIAAVNAIFSPTGSELDWARKVIDAYEPALEKGRGAILLDGSLVDMVHFRRAKDIIKKRQSRSGRGKPLG